MDDDLGWFDVAIVAVMGKYRRYEIPPHLKHFRWYKLSPRYFAIRLDHSHEVNFENTGLCEQDGSQVCFMAQPSSLTELLIV